MSKFCFTRARCRCHLGSGRGGGGSYDPGAWRGPSLTKAKAGVQEVMGCQGHWLEIGRLDWYLGLWFQSLCPLISFTIDHGQYKGDKDATQSKSLGREGNGHIE